MHLAQPSYPRSQAVPLSRLPLHRWHRGVGKSSDPSEAPGVFGPTAVKWYSKMAAARAILVDGLSCRQMGMVLSKTGAASSQRWGSRTSVSAETRCDELGGNDMMHLQAMRGPGPSRPHFVAS